jgi:uncharacterized protein (TIGR00290 family)
MPYKSFFNWSGGKDSSLALYHILNDKCYLVEKLLCAINSQYRCISIHGVGEELLEQQAKAINIPLQKLLLPDQPSMVEYEEQMMQTMKQLQKEKFTHSLFGDIFLQDLRTYRETQLAKAQMIAVFPLWERDTAKLIHEFIDLGFKAIVVCVKAELLDESFAGRVIDRDFLKDLPPGIDACGENGEFHTFVFDGPIFKKSVSFKSGKKVFREYKAPVNIKDETLTSEQKKPLSMGFWYCDLLAE